MIPRRLVAHLGHQRWTAIAIDFVIVVIGVFVGLQMSHWNEARIQAADEEATLKRLQAESGAIEAELIRVADQYSATLERYAQKLPVALSVALDPSSSFLRAVDWNVDPATWQTSEGVAGYDWTALLGTPDAG